MCADHFRAVQSQHGWNGQVAFPDCLLLIQGQQTDGSKSVEVAVASADLLEFQVRSLEFFILKLQLDLVNLQFVDEVTNVLL